MTTYRLTPSQTVGPYLAIGLRWPDGPHAVPPGAPGGVWLRGRVLDGNGEPVLDALVETWQADPDGAFDHPDAPRRPSAPAAQAFRGFGRSETLDGEYGIHTLKPGCVPDPTGALQAPHVDVSVFARGLLDRVVTRLYFGDEADANALDPVLRSLPDDRARRTLVATPSADGYRLDITLQGPDETVFFTL